MYSPTLRDALRQCVATGIAALLIAFQFAAPVPARAFVPTNLRAALLTSPFDDTHQSITASAIQDLDNEFFSIPKLTKPMKKALQQIVDANAAVDNDQVTSAKHFDGESFPEGQARVVSLLSDIQTALGAKNSQGARARLGEALHTIQDFYSHSNWIELGNGGANSSLGRPSGSLNRLAANVATCIGCTPCVNCANNLVTSLLTSGYYASQGLLGVTFEDRRKPNAGKCSHGGPLDASTNGINGGINKDSSVCSISPHSERHGAAASAAKDATKQFIRDIKALVTPSQLKLLLGVGPTLAIVMDTTGSMGSIINSVKQQAIQIVNARLGTDEEPSKYVLAPFNDPSVGPVTVTDDADVFKAAISSLFASGGGDCPELSQTGMLQGLGASDDGGAMFMFTDASSKDSGLAGNVSSLASSKDIKVYPILFGSCSPIDPGFIKVAADSGGQLFFLARFEAGAITGLADLVSRSNAVDVLSVAGTVAGSPLTFTAPVDSSMSKVTFSLSGPNSVVVTRPNGTTVQASDPGVTVLTLSGGVVVSVAAPAPGAWTATFSGFNVFSLSITGESPLDLTTFRFDQPGGRPGHEGLLPINGFPTAGQTATAEAVVSGSFNSMQFDLRDKAGNSLQPLSLTRGAGVAINQFFGDVAVPATPFLVYATGLNAAGQPFQRVIPASMRPQTVIITSPPPQDLAPGVVTAYAFQVKNLGPPDTFLATASDDQGFLQSVTPASFTLATGDSVTVTVRLLPPAGRGGVSDALTLTILSPTSGAGNFAVLNSFVVSNRPPDVSQAQANPSTLWPPNNKLAQIAITGVTDPDNDPVTIRIDRIMQDESITACPDATGIGGATAQVRAERDGSGDGRVYTIFFTATDNRGGSTTRSVKVSVPHDQGQGGTAVDQGPLFDSTNCTP